MASVPLFLPRSATTFSLSAAVVDFESTSRWTAPCLAMAALAAARSEVGVGAAAAAASRSPPPLPERRHEGGRQRRDRQGQSAARPARWEERGAVRRAGKCMVRTLVGPARHPGGRPRPVPGRVPGGRPERGEGTGAVRSAGPLRPAARGPVTTSGSPTTTVTSRLGAR